MSLFHVKEGLELPNIFVKIILVTMNLESIVNIWIFIIKFVMFSNATCCVAEEILFILFLFIYIFF